MKTIMIVISLQLLLIIPTANAQVDLSCSTAFNYSDEISQQLINVTANWTIYESTKRKLFLNCDYDFSIANDINEYDFEFSANYRNNYGKIFNKNFLTFKSHSDLDYRFESGESIGVYLYNKSPNYFEIGTGIVQRIDVEDEEAMGLLFQNCKFAVENVTISQGIQYKHNIDDFSKYLLKITLKLLFPIKRNVNFIVNISDEYEELESVSNDLKGTIGLEVHFD